MPIKPRGERGNKWLRYLFAALLLAIVVGGGAFAVTRIFGDDDGETPNGGQAAQITSTATSEAAASEPTETPATVAEPTQTPQEAEPTQTPEPSDEESSQEETDPPAEGEDADAVDQASESEDPAAAAEPTPSTQDFLPAVEALEGSWTVNDEGGLTRDEVGGQLGDDGVELLRGWRWRENQFRYFNRAAEEAAPEDISFVSVSVHRFANEEGASEALTYFSDIVITAQGLQEVPGLEIGDEARGLEGPAEGANLYVLYVRDGNYMIRLGGSSVSGDPAPFINALADQLVAST
jgi:hypothetical protein